MAKVRLGKEHLNAWRSLLLAHARSVILIAREIEDAGGLRLEWYDVLLELQSVPNGRLRLADLADRVVLTRSGISRLVTRLEAEGLVQRQETATDGRGVVAAITSEGRRRFKETWPLCAAGIAKHFAAKFSHAEAAEIRKLLMRLVDAHEAAQDI